MADVATRGAGLDWKTSLQELAPRSPASACPFYEVVDSGPDHAKTFPAMVRIDDQRYGPGAGRNKKEAEQKAAAAGALRRLNGRLRGPACAACLSFPRSRSSGAVSPPGITGRQIAAVEVLHPRPVRRHLPGAADFEHQLTGRTFAEPRRRGKYLWLPLDRRRCGAGPPGDERPVPARPRRAPRARQHPRADQLHRRRAASCGSSTSGCSAGCPCRPAGAELPAEVAHIGRDPLRSRVRPGRRRGRDCERSAPGSSGPCSTSS